MQQNATPGDEPTTPAGDQAEALEPVQEIALTALLAGRPITEAAAVAGCHRSTVYRWLQDDSLFVARLNASRREIADQARAELLALGTAAVAAIRETLENTDAPALRFRAAVKTLELLGLPGEPPAGPTDPLAVEIAWEAAEIDQRGELSRIALLRRLETDPGDGGPMAMLRRALGPGVSPADQAGG